MWGGTFNLSVGLGDEEHTPLEFPGPGGALTRRISIGAVDIGWAG